MTEPPRGTWLEAVRAFGVLAGGVAVLVFAVASACFATARRP